jgi:hypothetical protein
MLALNAPLTVMYAAMLLLALNVLMDTLLILENVHNAQQTVRSVQQLINVPNVMVVILLQMENATKP